MKKLAWLLAALFLLLTACGGETAVELSYQQITQEEAKNMMDQHADAIILDVREQDEFDAGHIPGAVLLPVGTITEETAVSSYTTGKFTALTLRPATPVTSTQREICSSPTGDSSIPLRKHSASWMNMIFCIPCVSGLL